MLDTSKILRKEMEETGEEFYLDFGNINVFFLITLHGLRVLSMRADRKFLKSFRLDYYFSFQVSYSDISFSLHACCHPRTDYQSNEMSDFRVDMCSKPYLIINKVFCFYCSTHDNSELMRDFLFS